MRSNSMHQPRDQVREGGASPPSWNTEKGTRTAQSGRTHPKGLNHRTYCCKQQIQGLEHNPTKGKSEPI